MNVIHDGTGDSKYRPCPLLRQYVDAGKLRLSCFQPWFSMSAALEIPLIDTCNSICIADSRTGVSDFALCRSAGQEDTSWSVQL